LGRETPLFRAFNLLIHLLNIFLLFRLSLLEARKNPQAGPQLCRHYIQHKQKLSPEDPT